MSGLDKFFKVQASGLRPIQNEDFCSGRRNKKPNFTTLNAINYAIEK